MAKIKIKKSKQGSLHSALGVPKGEKIPLSKLKDSSKDSPSMKKKKVFARNARKWNHGGNGISVFTPNADPNDPYDQSLFFDAPQGSNQYSQLSTPGVPIYPNGMPDLYYDPNYNQNQNQNFMYNPTTDTNIQNMNNMNMAKSSGGGSADRGRFKFPLINPTIFGGNKYFRDGAFNLSNAGIDFTKGFLEDAGINKGNRKVLSNERFLNRLSAQGATNFPPTDTKYNRNQTYFAFGGNMDINNTKSQFPTAEVEGSEVGFLPNGLAGEFHGNSHANGGIHVNLPNNTKIFSEELEHPTLNKSYAKLAKKYATEKDMGILEDPASDKISKATAEINTTLKTITLDNLFNEQEMYKLNGAHGKKVQREARSRIMEHGGILKYGNGGNDQPFHAWPDDIETLEKLGKITRYTWKDINEIDKTQHKGKSGVYGDITSDPKIMDEFYSRHQWVKPLYKEETKKEFDPSDPKAVKWMQSKYNDWFKEEFGTDYYKSPKKGESNPYGIDSKFGEYTYSMPIINRTTNWTGDLGTRPAIERATHEPVIYQNKPGEGMKFTRSQNPSKKIQNDEILNTPFEWGSTGNANLDGINLNLSLGRRPYGREPIATSVLNPEYIDPRYLDIQPQLNEITRGTRAFKRNLGSRSSVDVANLLQSQSNAYNAQNQVFGQKYNYDRQQDATAQQFNAQAKMNIDLQNLQERNSYLDKIATREGVIDTQKRTDEQADIQNYWNKQAYDQKYAFAKDAFAPLIDSNGKIFGYSPLPTDTYEKSKSEQESKLDNLVDYNKYGGKVKLKLKKKK